MVMPTPWQANHTRHETDPAHQQEGDEAVPSGAAGPRVELSTRLVALQGSWGYVCAAVGGLVTFVLLFQTWLTASGPDGQASSNAFGTIEASTSYLNALSQSSHTPQLTGTWAIFASAAIVVATVTALANVRMQTEALARLTMVATVVAATFVFFTLLYLNSKESDLKAMTMSSWDLGGQIGPLLHWAFGHGNLPALGVSHSQWATASLTPTALIAGAISLGSAVAAVTQWVRSYGTSPFHWKWRLPVVVLRPTAEADHTD